MTDRPSLLVPDFPFRYGHYLRHPAGVGSVPASAYGREVAVVGGGMAGLTAAYELMRMGLRPVVYEAGRLGGRLRGEYPLGADGPVADMGGMRFPVTGDAFHHYVDLLGCETEPFPNPLDPASPSTVIELAGQRHYARTPDDLPEFFREVRAAWDDAAEELGCFSEMARAIAENDLPAIKKIWDQLVPELDGTSFYHFLERSQAFSRLPFAYREAFGQVGFGTGGWDANFPESILEILRLVYGEAESNQLRIRGGAVTVPQRLWRHAPADLAHWPAGTSLSSLHDGDPRPGVRAIRRAEGGDVVITDRDGNTAEFDAVVLTCQVWQLGSRIETDPRLFSPELWTAIRRTHYVQSAKTFVAVDRPFWHDTDPATGEQLLSTTLTDRMSRQTYLLDDGPDRPALICLSYTWNDDALKFLTMDRDERVRVALADLAEIYPGLDVASHVVGEPVTVSWEDEPEFMGAFHDNLPGHYRYQERLFTQFRQGSRTPAAQRGLYLAGDDVSWIGGWADGAVTTAINAVWAVMDRFGGATDPANPGPGDVFDEIAPIRLP